MELIEQLINAEAQKASEKHPDFQSAHHGYAVILEEFEELKVCEHRLNEQLKALWKTTKEDRFAHQNDILNQMEFVIIALIKEAIQIGAMVRRYQTFLDNRKWKENI